VVSVRPIVKGVRLMLRQPADDREPVAKRGQGTQDWRQVEVRALADRGPVVDAGEIPGDAVRQVDEAEPPHGRRRRLRERRQCRHHRVEQRQGQRRANAAQERSPWQCCFRDEHQRYLSAS
jgi:hypothetical protein